jgi:flavin reductase (DIM6/NTAB) family NADH-FMN oxidoreductase RutF
MQRRSCRIFRPENVSGVTAGVLDELWAPLVAVTAAHRARANGLIASTALSASIVPESPRVLVCLARANLTHDLVLAAGAFAVHLLPAEPIEPSLDLFHALGTRSGREGEKLAAFPTSTGLTGAPLLDHALGYIEARVASTLELDELTVVVGEVVAERRLREGGHLTIELARDRLPPEWLDDWERRREDELRSARLLLGGGGPAATGPPR